MVAKQGEYLGEILRQDGHEKLQAARGDRSWERTAIEYQDLVRWTCQSRKVEAHQVGKM
jgi:hypothetical protein